MGKGAAIQENKKQAQWDGREGAGRKQKNKTFGLTNPGRIFKAAVSSLGTQEKLASGMQRSKLKYEEDTKDTSNTAFGILIPSRQKREGCGLLPSPSPELNPQDPIVP